jgi:hypothetical protein
MDSAARPKQTSWGSKLAPEMSCVVNTLAGVRNGDSVGTRPCGNRQSRTAMQVRRGLDADLRDVASVASHPAPASTDS